MVNQNNNIIYDIINRELKTDLPVGATDKDYNFVFTGFSDEAYHRGNKPYVFIANLTESKKNEIEARGVTLAQTTDDKEVLFDWGDLIWHFDFLYDDYLRLYENGETKGGRIYFVRKDDNEIINTPGQTITEAELIKKTKTFKEADYKDLLNRIVLDINRADQILNNESQS